MINVSTLKQRVQCVACRWSGGRVIHPAGDYAPCSKCGGRVQAVGEPFAEVRTLSACTRCGWSSMRISGSVERPCPMCAGSCVAARLVDAQGVSLPYADGESRA